jgi:pSer/pThr/pTyr-binding forkhead associated (FHA) protein
MEGGHPLALDGMQIGGAPAPATAAMAGFGADRTPTGARRLVGFLISYQENPVGQFWPIYEGANVVGRAETGESVDIAVAHGTTSTTHASIECSANAMTLVDLGSTNGTFHNEEAIGSRGRRSLRDGDKVRFGGFSAIVLNAAARF